MERVLESFKTDFNSVKGKWVQSNRANNTGIGKTFEDIMGVKENNSHLPDYQGILEIKSSRDLSESLVTLFTKNPYPRGINAVLREKYGIIDERYNDYKLFCTFDTDYYPAYDKYAFKLEFDFENDKVFIVIKDLKTNEIENISPQPYLVLSELKEKVENKCKYIAYVTAKTKEIKGIEYFKFEKAVLLTGLTFDKFIEFVNLGHIKHDIRQGFKRNGERHDHGTGFRFKKNRMDKMFKIEEIGLNSNLLDFF